jgi:hypothetical protein
MRTALGCNLRYQFCSPNVCPMPKMMCVGQLWEYGLECCGLSTQADCTLVTRGRLPCGVVQRVSARIMRSFWVARNKVLLMVSSVVLRISPTARKRKPW